MQLHINLLLDKSKLHPILAKMANISHRNAGPQLLHSMRSCQVGLNSIHFKTLKTAKIVLTFLLISQE